MRLKLFIRNDCVCDNAADRKTEHSFECSDPVLIANRGAITNGSSTQKDVRSSAALGRTSIVDLEA
jgi:hypothetical protein